ncbi:hypothetical protein SUGI_0704290 [Cryptomeria japonica]|nr:hypothetical protein SUGI_0704290 [Cryptomeria japonica]
MGQTALHKAAKWGHMDTVKVLLHWGAQPLVERDCDGKTALHYAVQAKTGEDGIALADLLLKKCESKQLFILCAAAEGLGTADQILPDCTLKTFLLKKKKDLIEEGENLLQTAARIGDTEITKDLLRSGYQIAVIQEKQWYDKLEGKEKINVHKGRADFAHGLAALLLNPYLKPPIAIGISGSWGMGKSSLMVQTENIMLKAAAQSALLPTSSSTSSNLPGVHEIKLSPVGKKKKKEIERWIRPLTKTSKESQGKQPEDLLEEFLDNYKPEYHKIFKSLAAIDSGDMVSILQVERLRYFNIDFYQKPDTQFSDRLPFQQSHSGSNSPSEGSVPAIITIQYNAWKYRNESEELAGMAVEITKEMEGIMTGPQWLSTCWRNTWTKQKQTILMEVIFPCLLSIFLAGAFTWIVWVLLDRYNVKESEKLKYGSLPATIVIMVWTLVKSVMSTVNPVSTQLMNYIKFPDHTENLGYQERVISDITFLKREIRKKPFFLCTAASCIWHLINGCCMISYFYSKFCQEDITNSIAASTSTSYTSNNPRIVVFVDDLDRCEESVILQVLSAINLVLAVCEISAVVGMDKSLIERAIIKMYGGESLQNGKELVDKYLQKIIQLPLDLPDPTEDDSKTFLQRQLGVFSKQRRNEDGGSIADVHKDCDSEDPDYAVLFSTIEIEDGIENLADQLKKKFSSDASTPDASGEDSIDVTNPNASTQMETESHPQTNTNKEIAIDVTNTNDANSKSSGEQSLLQREGKAPVGKEPGEQSSSQLAETTSKLEMSALLSSIDLKWDRIGILKNYKSDSDSGSSEPSLRAIVEDYIENENKYKEPSDSGDDKHKTKDSKDSGSKELKTEKPEEDLKANDVSKKSTEEKKAVKSKEDSKGKAISKNMENPESSNGETVQLEAIEEEKMVKMPDYQGDAFERSEKLEGGRKEKDVSHDVTDDNESSKREIDKLKEVVKSQMITRIEAESNNRAISVKLYDVVKTLRNEIEKALKELEDVKKEIRDLKETKQQTVKNNQIDEKEQKRVNNWKRMNEALKIYDVSMEGIQAFQKFRFYCVPRYLPWPLSKKETEGS